MDTKDCAKKIYEIIVEEVEKANKVYQKKVDNIDLDYFEIMVRDSEVLPAELNLELRKTILTDMRLLAHNLLEESAVKTRINEVLDNLSESDAADVWNIVKTEHIDNYVRCSKVMNGETNVSHQELKVLFENAKRRTLWERITRTNKTDIMEFYHALMDKTYADCNDIFYDCVRGYFN